MTVDENSRTIVMSPRREGIAWLPVLSWADIYAAGGLTAFLLLYHYWTHLIQTPSRYQNPG